MSIDPANTLDAEYLHATHREKNVLRYLAESAAQMSDKGLLEIQQYASAELQKRANPKPQKFVRPGQDSSDLAVFLRRIQENIKDPLPCAQR